MVNYNQITQIRRKASLPFGRMIRFLKNAAWILALPCLRSCKGFQMRSQPSEACRGHMSCPCPPSTSPQVTRTGPLWVLEHTKLGPASGSSPCFLLARTLSLAE